MNTPKTSQKRQDIIDTALKLFNQYGYVSVGVDKIIAESGVAKMTFYKFFPSKDDLIKETLITRDKMIRQDIEKTIASTAPKKKSNTPHLDALFDWYASWFDSKDFYGCMFIKATDEFVDNEELNKIVREHKDWMNYKVVDILKKDNAETSPKLAKQICVLLDGAIVDKTIYKDSSILETSRSFVHKMITG